MNETVITWTVSNWITVFLMFIGAALIFGVVLKLFAKMRAAKMGE